jgi:hypothetical protein
MILLPLGAPGLCVPSQQIPGSDKAGKKNRQQQNDLLTRQNQERQSHSEHLGMAQRAVSDARTQQLEQRHQHPPVS